MFQSCFENVRPGIMDTESMYSRTVRNLIPCPKIFLINAFHIDNVNTLECIHSMVLIHIMIKIMFISFSEEIFISHIFSPFFFVH